MGVTPWDAGDVQPSLREALALLALPKQAGRALVPGCGSVSCSVQSSQSTTSPKHPRDTIYHTSLHKQDFPLSDWTFLRLQGSAVRSKRNLIFISPHVHTIWRMIQKVKSQDPSIQASFEISDFFKYDPPRDQLFDLIYDHTYVYL